MTPLQGDPVARAIPRTRDIGTKPARFNDPRGRKDGVRAAPRKPSPGNLEPSSPDLIRAIRVEAADAGGPGERVAARSTRA